MKILGRQQLKQADEYTIEHEPISSANLMDRASRAIAHRLEILIPKEAPILILCGMGNNGGDGMVVGDMLKRSDREVEICVLKHADQSSPEQRHFARHINFNFFHSFDEIEDSIQPDTVIVDALLGNGQDRPLSSPFLDVIQALNRRSNDVIAIDIPTGMMTNGDQKENSEILHCRHTISLQYPKLAFLLPPTGAATQSFEVVDIGLHKDFENSVETPFHFTKQEDLQLLIRRRDTFSHKGDFGHVFLLAGSPTMSGAALLSSGGVLRSGAGKLTVCSYESVLNALRVSWPEAMVQSIETDGLSQLQSQHILVVGPGIGKNKQAFELLQSALEKVSKPCVIDADALNILSERPELWGLIPKNSILTPHPGEFERLTSHHFSYKNGLDKARIFAQEKKIYLMVKGAYSAICTPDGEVHFNSTGNSSMAKGGSGDVLSGIISSLLAQNYSPLNAARIGAYVHGLAGDLALQDYSPFSVIASDLIENIGKAFLQLMERREDKKT